MYKRFLIFALVLGITGAAYADITTGLVAHYQFEDNANDSAGSYDGTLSASGASYGTPGIHLGTMSGKTLTLNGSGYVDIPGAALNQNSSAITIAFWAKSYEAYPGTGITQPSIAAAGANNGVMDAMEPYWNPVYWWKRTIWWYSYSDTGGPGLMAGGYYYFCCQPGASQFMNALYKEYTHWAYTYDATTGDGGLWINGVKWFGYGGKTALLPAMSAARIGAKMDLSAYRHGTIDDFRIYTRALGSADLTELIPEPATIALLGLGGLALIRKRR
jgi:hypothetical protein